MTPDPAASSREPLRGAATFSSLWLSLRALARSSLNLFLLEARQAGISAVFMLAAGLAAMVLAVTGWLAIVACIVVALVENDVLSWATALIVAALLSFAGAGALGFFIIKTSKQLLFTATRRQLLGSEPSAPAGVPAVQTANVPTVPTVPSEHGKTG